MLTTQDDPSKVLDSNSSVDHFDYDGLVSKKVVAEYLDVTAQTVDVYRRLKLIPYIKINGAIRFRLADVKEAIQRNYTVAEVSR